MFGNCVKGFPHLNKKYAINTFQIYFSLWINCVFNHFKLQLLFLQQFLQRYTYESIFCIIIFFEKDTQMAIFCDCEG